ncbi:hypothetical protein quinque_013999 [Culex quinquefasciatus]
MVVLYDCRIFRTLMFPVAAANRIYPGQAGPDDPAEVDAVGTLRLLDVIRTCGLEKSVKFYQTSSLELHGKVLETPQNEKKTPFNHESPMRGENFVSRKITRTVAKIFLGQLT